MILLGARFNSAVIGRVNPQHTGMKVLNQRFKGCKLSNAAFPLTLDRVELFTLHHISTEHGVFDHSHRWRAGNEFTGFIILK